VFLSKRTSTPPELAQQGSALDVYSAGAARLVDGLRPQLVPPSRGGRWFQLVPADDRGAGRGAESAVALVDFLLFLRDIASQCSSSP
jgi:hypothetical protein